MTSRSMRDLWTMAEGLRHGIQSPLATTHNTLHTHAHACTPEHVCHTHHVLISAEPQQGVVGLPLLLQSPVAPRTTCEGTDTFSITPLLFSGHTVGR